MTGAADTAILHASAVAWKGCGVLICGASGSGKSGLALQLMAFGAELVSDDRTTLTGQCGALIASAPEAISGLIEARRIGLLRAETAGAVPIRLAVDLDLDANARLADLGRFSAEGVSVPLIAGKGVPNLAAAILQCLKGGLVEAL